MDMLALAPGVRMALKALGFNPDQIVELMTSINSNIAKVGSELELIRIQNSEILERLGNLEARQTSPAPALDNHVHYVGGTETENDAPLPEHVPGDGYHSN